MNDKAVILCEEFTEDYRVKLYTDIGPKTATVIFVGAPEGEMFLWRTRMKEIPCKEKLAAHGVMVGQMDYFMCSNAIETSYNLFTSCYFVMRICS